MSKRVYRFDWAGASVFVLSLSLGIGFAGTLIIISGPWDPDPLTEGGATLLSTVGGVLAGAVAAYFGVHVERSANGRRTEVSEPAAVASQPVAVDEAYEREASGE